MRSRTGFTIGYDLGFVGTSLRLAFGVAAPLGYTLRELFGGRHPAGWHADVGVDFLLILGAYTAVHYLLGERVLTRVSPWVGTVIFYGPVFLLPYVDFLSLTFRFAVSLYIASSTLVVVFIRYGGCEVVGIPSLLLRRRYVVYCPWNAVDVVDKAIADSHWMGRLLGWGVKVTAAMAVGAAFTSLGVYRPDWLPYPILWALYGAAGIAVVVLWRLGVLVWRRAGRALTTYEPATNAVGVDESIPPEIR